MSDIRFNQWLHQSGTGGVSQDHIGNIGIGTTNPSIVVSAANTAVLNVGVITANNLFVNNAFNGDITGNVTGNISGATGTFSGNVDIADKIIHTGDTDTAMRFPADNTFAVDTAGSERIRITSGGLVGIGTDIPGNILDVQGTTHTKIHVGTTGTGHATGIQINHAKGNAALQEWQLQTDGSADGNLKIRNATSSTDVMFFDADNNKIGVNCTPLGQFQVKAGTNQNIALSSMSSEAAIEAFNDAGSANVPLRLRASVHKFFIGSTEGLRVHTNGLIGVGYDSPTAYGRMTVAMPSQSGGAAIQVANSSNGSGDGSTSNIVLRSVNNSGSNWAGAEYRASDHIFAIQGSEKVRISSGGLAINKSAAADAEIEIVQSADPTLRLHDTRNAAYKADFLMAGSAPVIRNNNTTAADRTLTIQKGLTDHLVIDGSGQVATPLQPRFFARRSADQTSYDGRNVGGTWVTYDVEDYDIGGNFATSGSDQGRFIAPVSGLYLFHAAAYKQSGTADWSQSWFDIDGSRANGTDWVFSSSTRFAQNSIQIYLTAGQKIGFHPYNNASGNTIIDTATHTWFKGCLLG